jgi:hypothetical protein
MYMSTMYVRQVSRKTDIFHGLYKEEKSYPQLQYMYVRHCLVWPQLQLSSQLSATAS